MAAVVDGEGPDCGCEPLLPRSRRGSRPGSSPERASSTSSRSAKTTRCASVADGESAPSLRAVHVPAEPAGESGAGTFLLFDDESAGSLAQSSNLQALLDVLPVGLALVDRDGRFLTMNQAFRQAAGIKGTKMPVYPGDLVVKEDKAAVADAVRRNARGPAMSGDLGDPSRSSAGRAGRADHRRPARDRRCRGPAAAQGQQRGSQAQAPGRAGDQDAGRRPAGRRRRARLQQHPDRDHRPLRPDADAPHAGRQRL